MIGIVPRVVVHAVEQHGVASYASDVARAISGAGLPDPSVLRSDLPSLAAGTPVHLQFTDRLWAASPEAAAAAVVELGAQHPLSVTLHDLPQPSDGARNLPRRLECYRAVAATALGVVVNSGHEAELLREHGVRAAAVGVIPLPVDVAPPGDRSTTGRDVGVLGFFYPGKGHDEALGAAVAAGARSMSILGRASDGHAADLDAFVRGAAAQGVAVEVTGYLGDAELVRRCRLVGVPVIAHRHVSASGSLGSWIAAGRRPVATENRYIAEMAALRRGTITAVPPDRLDRAIAATLQHPESTWLSTSTVPHGRREVAAAYVDWWTGLPW